MSKKGYWDYPLIKMVIDHNDPHCIRGTMYDPKTLKEIKTAVARCHPEDKFNFAVGAELCLKRLLSRENVETKSQHNNNQTNWDFSIGEKVMVVRDGQRYSAWNELMDAKFPSYKHSWESTNDRHENGAIGMVVGRTHGLKDDFNSLYYLVMYDDNCKCAIYNAKGLLSV